MVEYSLVSKSNLKRYEKKNDRSHTYNLCNISYNNDNSIASNERRHQKTDNIFEENNFDIVDENAEGSNAADWESEDEFDATDFYSLRAAPGKSRLLRNGGPGHSRQMRKMLMTL